MRIPGALIIGFAVARLWAADATVRPGLVYSKAFGGTGSDIATAVAADAEGNSYITGYTTSANFPVKGGFQNRIGGTPLRASTDSGKTWFAPDIPQGVVAIAGSPNQPTVLYAGTSTGLYRSPDSGNTWSQVSTFSPALEIHSVALDENAPAAIFVATNQGIFRSLDNAVTWYPSSQGLQGTDAADTELASGPGMLLAYQSGEFYRSTDGAATWTLLQLPIFGSISFDSFHPNVLYVFSLVSG